MNTNDATEVRKPRWYSIQEAAEFLEVGEPTLYRWMREGSITYRKIGDSTRFWREDLEAVMEVFPSRKDTENLKKVCAACHTGQLVEGVFRTTGLNYFQPRKTKFWTLKDSNIETQAFMCDHCGSVSLFGNTAKLEALMEKKIEQEGERKSDK